MAKKTKLRMIDEEDAAGNMLLLVPGIKNSRLWNGLARMICPGVKGLLRQVAYELIPADHEHLKSLA